MGPKVLNPARLYPFQSMHQNRAGACQSAHVAHFISKGELYANPRSLQCRLPDLRCRNVLLRGLLAKKELPITFEDLNKIDLNEWGVTEDEATRLLHVIHDGKLYAGTKAFLILWEQMPRYRLLAKIGRLPLIYHMADVLYVHLVARIIYNRHIRRKARGLIQRS